MKPFTIVIGKDESSLDSFCDRVENIEYETKSWLESVNLLGKFYVTFNIKFLVESENIYQYFLRGLYKINRKIDPDIL